MSDSNNIAELISLQQTGDMRHDERLRALAGQAPTTEPTLLTIWRHLAWIFQRLIAHDQRNRERDAEMAALVQRVEILEGRQDA